MAYKDKTGLVTAFIMPLVFLVGAFIGGFILSLSFSHLDPGAGLGGIFYVPFVIIGALASGVGSCISVLHLLIGTRQTGEVYLYNKPMLFGNFAWMSTAVTIVIIYLGVKVWSFINNHGQATTGNYYITLGIGASIYYIGMVGAFIIAKNNARTH